MSVKHVGKRGKRQQRMAMLRTAFKARNKVSLDWWKVKANRDARR